MTTHSRYILALLAVAFLLLPVAAAAQHPQPLTITDGPRIEYVGPSSAEIAWTTSTGGSTLVRYGTNPNGLNQVAESAYDRGQGSHHVTHRVTIKHLQPNTTYYFMVDSGQGQGTGTEVRSPVASFKTKGGAPGESESGDSAQERQPVRITDGPRVESAGNNSAVIAWTTNAASSSVVRYGTNPNSLNQTAQAPYADAEGASKQTHRVRIDNLQPHTTYYFMVDSGQGEGTGTEAKSPVAQFQTR